MCMINAAALCEYANNQKSKTIDANDIMRFPTVDAEPVRHGTWERKSCVKGKQYDPTTDYWAYAHRCSECDKVSYFPNDIPDKWCRHCGAKMDGDGDAS